MNDKEVKQSGDLENRNATMLQLWRSGETLESIGSLYGITRERVRQIIELRILKEYASNLKYKDLSSKQIISAEKQSRENFADEVKRRMKNKKHERLVQMFKTGNSVEAIAKYSGKSERYVTDKLIKEGLIHKISKKVPAGKWSLDYDACKLCGETRSKHHSHGYCERCFPKTDIFKSYQKKWADKNRYKLKIKNKLYNQRYKQRPEVKEKRKNEQDQIMFGGNRSKALERDAYKCSICGLTQKEGEKKYHRDLYVTHVDHNLGNNLLENLRTMCRGCFIATRQYPSYVANATLVVPARLYHSSIRSMVEGRNPNARKAMRLAIYLMKKHDRLTVDQIATKLDVARATVISACRDVEQQMHSIPEYLLLAHEAGQRIEALKSDHPTRDIV